jgi:hypothetical protein
VTFKFERFEAWKRAIDFADAMFELADGLPQRYQISLGGQDSQLSIPPLPRLVCMSTGAVL